MQASAAAGTQARGVQCLHNGLVMFLVLHTLPLSGVMLSRVGRSGVPASGLSGAPSLALKQDIWPTRT